MGTTRRIIALVSGLLALVLAALWWQQRTATPGDGTAVPSAIAPASGATTTTGSTPSPSSTAPGTPSRTPSTGHSPTIRSTPAASATPGLPAGCTASPSPMVPTRIEVGSRGVDSPVLSLGMADDGSIATPPFDQPRSVGWFNQGPRPGSSQGKVVLTAHTFHAGGALGNQLVDADQGLHPGDVIRLRDANGQVQCYRYAAAQKIMVKDYDPSSTAIYDTTGRPMLAIVVCWDWEPSTRFWASRIVFYATPMAG